MTISKHTPAEGIIGCALIVLGVPVGVLWRAYVFAVLWGWFAVPLGAPALTFAAAIGLLLLVSLSTAHLANDKTDTDDGMWEAIGTMLAKIILIPLVPLVVGWVIQRWWL